MIKLVKLSFQNIGRFVEMQTVDFSTKQKLLQFDGKNENTGGSSGSGKSTVFNALDLLLGVNDIPVSSLQSRLTKSGYYVSGDFEIDGVPVTITRSKKDGLIVKTPSETVEGNVKLGEEKIDQLVKIPRKIFGKMIHKRQKASGFFLAMTAKESYQFLIDSLDLHEWDSKADKIGEDIKTKEQQLKALEIGIEADRNSLESLKNTLSGIVKPSHVDIDELTKNAETQQIVISSCDEKITQFNIEMKNAVFTIEKERDSKLPPMPEIDQASEMAVLRDELVKITQKEASKKSEINLSEIDTKLKAVNAKVVEVSYKEREIKALASQIAELKQQKSHIKEAICPTCSQEWKGETAESKLKTLNQNIEEKTKQILEYKALFDNLPRLQQVAAQLEEDKKQANLKLQEISTTYASLKSGISNKINNLESTKKQIITEWTNKKLQITLEYKQKISESEKSFMDLIGVAQESKRIAQDILKDIQNAITNYNTALSAYERSSASTVQSIELKTKDIQTKEEATISIKREVIVATESQRLIKSYTMQVFQDTLNMIGSLSTEILNAVPTMSNATVFFDNCRETKQGKLKDEINCIINLDGENDISIKTLSGGEGTAVELAVDLAVVEILESQTGVGASWLVLDEPMNGMDDLGCEAFVEVVKQIGLKKQVIIVEHRDSVKELMEETITVKRSGEKSEIMQ
jgi:DNA repair exonuclease SbcCD ATPase subunit